MSVGFQRSKLIKGKIFVPDKTPGRPKKHPCKDCFACQMCPEDRCTLCRGREANPGPDGEAGEHGTRH